MSVATDSSTAKPSGDLAAVASLAGSVALGGFPENLHTAHERGSHARRTMPNGTAVAILDTALAVAALLVVLLWLNRAHMPRGLDFLALRVTLKNVLMLGAFVAAWSPLFRLCGLYDLDRTRQLRDELTRLAIASLAGTLLVLPMALTSRSGVFGAAGPLYFWVIAFSAGSCGRVARRVCTGRQRARRVLIVGTGCRAQLLYRQLASDRDTSYSVIGFVDNYPGAVADRPEGPKTLGTLDQLEDILMHEPVDELFVALPFKSQYPAVQEVITTCERVGVRVTYNADIFDTSLAHPRYSDTMGSPGVTMHSAPQDEGLLMLKRLIDVAGASVALTLFGPLMLAAAIAVKVTSPGPVIFAQERYGLNKRRFKMYKFRTMVVGAETLQARLESRNEAEGPVFKIRKDPRLTAVGRLLRKTSIDEMPQFINVIRGEMSLVGPRPLPLRDVQRFTQPTNMRRFSVRPGITGLWQISGRSTLPFTEWIRLDLAYIDQWSPALDIQILLRTLPAVLKGTGAS